MKNRVKLKDNGVLIIELTCSELIDIADRHYVPVVLTTRGGKQWLVANVGRNAHQDGKVQQVMYVAELSELLDF